MGAMKKDILIAFWRDLALEFLSFRHYFGEDEQGFVERAAAVRTLWGEAAEGFSNPLPLWKHLTYRLAKAMVPKEGEVWVSRNLEPEAQALYALALEGGFQIEKARRAEVRGRFLPGFFPSAALAWLALRQGVDLREAEAALEAFLRGVRGKGGEEEEEEAPFGEEPLSGREDLPPEDLVDAAFRDSIPDHLLPDALLYAEVEVAAPPPLPLDDRAVEWGEAPEHPVLVAFRDQEGLMPVAVLGEAFLLLPPRKKRG